MSFIDKHLLFVDGLPMSSFPEFLHSYAIIPENNYKYKRDQVEISLVNQRKLPPTS